jgi:predicted porin
MSGNLWSLGVEVPVTTKDTIGIQYAQFKAKELSDDNKSKTYSIDYQHFFSKRTTLYAVVSKTSNDDGLGFSATVQGRTAGRAGLGGIGENSTFFVVGLTHVF